MTDYNDGKWHGWNGGECPVHPKSVVDVCTKDEGVDYENRAQTWDWTEEDIVAFRVVTPYVEPQTYTGKCWAYHYSGQSAPEFYLMNSCGACIAGTWTAEHVNGKLARFSWEADE